VTAGPAWRPAYDAVERAVTPRVDAVVRSGQFARTVAWGTRARRAVGDRVNGVSARLWSLVNLPAGTDVQRLRAQVGALDREVRRLTLQLARQTEQIPEEVR
jgi:hypothetical protein